MTEFEFAAQVFGLISAAWFIPFAAARSVEFFTKVAE